MNPGVTDMPHWQPPAWPMGAISHRVQEREILRQFRFNNTRKVAMRSRIAAHNSLASRVPVLIREFAKALLGALVGFLIIAKLLAYLANVHEIYTFSVLGLFYSAQSTYYKYKLAADPGFKIPSCRCAGRSADGTESVLQSRHSAIAGIPNSVFAAAFFCAVLILTAVEQPRMALPLAAAAVAVSIYMSYVMLVRIRSLCAICVNITALGALILWQLLG
jgi:uncharacterized membrane protein